MFSELAWGSCDLDGAVDFDSIYSKIGRATPINSKRASNKARSTASSAVYLRHRSAATSASNGQSTQKANELILPKTYITRKGHLVLFAIIDNELFALVNSSRIASRIFNDVNTNTGSKNVEMLSQFSTLEEFVLTVLSYKHTKEKNLYASALKKVSQFQRQQQQQRVTKQRNKSIEVEKPRWRDELTVDANDSIQMEEYTALTQVTIGSSPPPSSPEPFPNSTTTDHQHVEYTGLALPPSKISDRGKLRSPLLARKTQQIADKDETESKQYISLNMALSPRNGRTTENILNRSRGNERPKVAMSREQDIMMGISGVETNHNQGFVPESVKHIIKNISENQRSPSPGWQMNASDSVVSPGPRLLSPVPNTSGNTAEKNTVLPFIFDNKPGPGYRIERLKKGNALHKTDRPSSSLADSENINLNPRISSSKPAPETRALGVTPSSISFTSDEFAKLLEVKSSHEFSVKIPVNGRDDNDNSTSLKWDKFQDYSREDTYSSGNKTVDIQESSDSIAQASNKVQRDQSVNEFDSIIREGSLLSISEANRRMGQSTPSSGKLLERELTGSVMSYLHDDNTDDDDDRILFSYISPSLQKGSWNPMVSFSFEDSSREVSQDGMFVEKNSLRQTRSEADWHAMDNRDNSLYNSTDEIYKGFIRELKSAKSAKLQRQRSQRQRSPREELQRYITKNSTVSPDLFTPNEYHKFSRPLSRDSKSSRLDQATKYQYERDLTVDESENDENFSRFGIVPGNQSERNSLDASIASHHRERSDINRENIDKERTGSSSGHSLVKREGTEDILARESTFNSNTATNVSVRDSIADARLITGPESPKGRGINSNSVGSESSSQNQESNSYRGTPTVWLDANSNQASDYNYSENLVDSATISEKISPYQQNDLLHGVRHVEATNISNADAERSFQANVVSNGLENERNLKKESDPIRQGAKMGRERVFVENSVFGTQQLFASQSQFAMNGAEARGLGENEELQASHEKLTETVENKGIKIDLGYEKDLLMGKKVGYANFEDNTGVADDMNSSQKATTEGKDNGKRVTVNKSKEKQTVELKIDLKVNNESSPDSSSVEMNKPVMGSDKEASPVAQGKLRLDGIGGSDVKDDKATLDELKTLLQKNKAETKRKPIDRAGLKRTTQKPKKKKAAAALSKKGVDAKNQSPLFDLPKKMETVETMISQKSDDLLKQSPETTPEDASRKEAVSDGEAVVEKDVGEKEASTDSETGVKKPASSKTVRIQNVQVKKVSTVDAEKKGAYPPSKPKRGGRMSKKVGSAKEKEKDNLQYEEQMKVLKEKEIEQQRAREAAMAKQKALEEEKEKYIEEEVEAKKQEDEARRKLIEAKVKAKEEREMKRLADAEKRRQIVEQRREERRQKELELVEKEKAAERLKHERERRSEELKRERERFREQERIEEEEMLEKERLEALKKEEEEQKLEEERLKIAQEELERLVEEREYREQLRRVAEAQEEKMREAEEQRRIAEKEEEKRIADERELLKRVEYLKLQAELERQKEAEKLAEERQKLSMLKSSKRKAELIKRREENLERMLDLKCKRTAQGISRAFTFTYFVHIPRSVWELPIGWNNKKTKNVGRGKNRPISVSANGRSTK